LLLDGSIGRIAREHSGGWISFLLSTSFHHGSPCSYITWVICLLMAAVQRCSLTPST
jgi:hypothetical protein